MTINQWNELAENDRVSFVKAMAGEFEVPESQAAKIYDFALQSFRSRFDGAIDITAIHMARNPESQLPAILVASVCRETNELSLPTPTFLGFQVIHQSYRKMRERYLDTWIVIFEQILNWSRTATIQWSEKWSDQLCGKNPLFYHRSPAYYAADAIIDNLSPIQKKGLARVTFRQKIAEAIEGVFPEFKEYPNECADFNWRIARERVEQIMSETHM